MAGPNVGGRYQMGDLNDGMDNRRSNFGASDAPNGNTVGMPQDPRMGGPRMSGSDVGGPYEMGNFNDSMGRFRGPGPGMMNDTDGNSNSGTANNSMKNFTGPQGRYPPPTNMGNMQGFGNTGGSAASHNFAGMEMSGSRMPGPVNNTQQSSGRGMRMPMGGEEPRGFATGRGLSGADNTNSVQGGQGMRMMYGNNSQGSAPSDRSGLPGNNPGFPQRPPYDNPVRFGNMNSMQDRDMQSGGSGRDNFLNMSGGPMSGVMNDFPESGMSQERMPNLGKPGNVRPLLNDAFFNQTAGLREPTPVPPPQPGKQGSTNSAPPPPPPPPPQQENKNMSSATPPTFGPVPPVGAPSVPPVGVPPPPPSQGSVTDQQTAEQMQAAMAYYYSQWMQQQQQLQQPPPPPPPPPK